MKNNLTTDIVIKTLNVSRRTLLLWRKNGKGPKFIRIGGRVFYPQDALIKYQRLGEAANATTTSSTDRAKQ